MIRFVPWYVLFLLLSGSASTQSAPFQQEAPVSKKLLPTGRLLSPAGESLSFYGRPVDMEVDAEGKLLFVKDNRSLKIIDAEKFSVLQSIASPGGASLYGLAVANDGRVYFSNAGDEVHEFAEDDAGRWSIIRSIKLPADSFPCGIGFLPDQSVLAVCLSKKNQLALIDRAEGTVKQLINVGIAPFDVVPFGDGKLAVSNLGGRRPKPGDTTAPSAGTETVTDERGVASQGSVSIIDVSLAAVVQQIPVDRHSSVMTAAGNAVYVCNSNDDSISRIPIGAGAVSTMTVKPDENLPFGSMPNAIHPINHGDQMVVALAGNNALTIANTNDGNLEFLGWVPTGWFPAAIAQNQKHLFVANTKGVGAWAERRPQEEGHNSHDHLGTVQRIELADLADDAKLAEWTEAVRKNSRVPQILRANEMEQRPGNLKPVPVPEKLGEPSLFKHVIYVIKENRTFDQVFGDIKEARSDQRLCIFPEKITPNHHALARRFGILDNYYCNGVLSADGHSWATEGNVTPYLERAFGGFARSYTFGDDPLTYSSSGFIWDRFLDAGLSFRNYGEMNYSEPPAGMKYQEIWKAYQEGQPIEFQNKIGIDRLRKYSCLDYPGWNMVIPDVLRMDRFLKEFREFEKNDGLPALTLVYLPQDHLGGGVTSRAHMADNDLALGRLVESISKSKYWQDTVIFINEDDPQNGFDHIDGHRSICLVISPYSKPGINHQFYNQTSVLRTLLHMFGLPPLNQQDSSAPLMTGCFQPVADLTPYEAIQSDIPLNEAPPAPDQQGAIEKKWRAILATVPIERTGLKTEQDEDNLNRFVWHETRGWQTPYPEKWSGAHGKGLKRLGLVLDPNDQGDD